MRTAALSTAALAMALAVAACETAPTQPLGPQGSGGIASGAQGGGVVADDAGTDTTASVTPTTGAGSLVDAGRGAAFASALAADDVRFFQQAEISARTAFVGSTIQWQNPGSGTIGTITPLSDRTIGGQECRDFFLTATINGRQHSETATACQSGSDWAPLPA